MDGGQVYNSMKTNCEGELKNMQNGKTEPFWLWISPGGISWVPCIMYQVWGLSQGDLQLFDTRWELLLVTPTLFC